MEKKIELLPPHMPNFIRTSIGQTIPIGNLYEDEAEVYGELMKKEFIKHWKKMKNNSGL